MELELYRHRWGVSEPLEVFAQKAKTRGYAGLEIWMPGITDKPYLQDVLATLDLKLIAMITPMPEPSKGQGVQTHLELFTRQASEAAELGPVKINAHAGFDGWSAAEQDDFYGAALDMVAKLPVPLAFETHRGRPLFNPWNTDRLLHTFPQMALTLDISHWVVVCERLMDDQIEIIERAAQACLHIHARVGYEQGPQVPDPRAPEYAQHLVAHERWWRMVWAAQEALGHGITTLTPEFGPPPYLHTLPHTNVPVVSLEEVCEWMAERQREHFWGRKGEAA